MFSISRTTYSLISVLALSTSFAAAQDVTYDASHNITSLLGTWSSGSGAVRTGVGFANPVNFTFEYPPTTGVSYSFTVDALSDGSSGYFEEAQYRFMGNGTRPNCIVGIVQWQHGAYTLNSNGSISLNPFPEDGRQQVQDMCASKSNVIRQFNQTTYFAGWGITQDPQKGPKLQLLRFDGALLSPLYLVSPDPMMLPTQPLSTNVTAEPIYGGGSSRRMEVSMTPAALLTGLATLLGLAALV